MRHALHIPSVSNRQFVRADGPYNGFRWLNDGKVNVLSFSGKSGFFFVPPFHPSLVQKLTPNLPGKESKLLVHRPALGSHYIGQARIKIAFTKLTECGVRGASQEGLIDNDIYSTSPHTIHRLSESIISGHEGQRSKVEVK